jgi:hypothetical protein
VQCKQKWLNLARRIEDIRYTKNSLIIDLWEDDLDDR